MAPMVPQNEVNQRDLDRWVLVVLEMQDATECIGG